MRGPEFLAKFWFGMRSPPAITGDYSDGIIYCDGGHNSPFLEQETGRGLTDLRTSHRSRKVRFL